MMESKNGTKNRGKKWNKKIEAKNRSKNIME